MIQHPVWFPSLEVEMNRREWAFEESRAWFRKGDPEGRVVDAYRHRDGTKLAVVGWRETLESSDSSYGVEVVRLVSRGGRRVVTLSGDRYSNLSDMPEVFESYRTGQYDGLENFARVPAVTVP